MINSAALDICIALDLDPLLHLDKRRRNANVRNRAIIAYGLVNYYNYSNEDVAKYFGLEESAIRHYKRLVANDPAIGNEINRLRKKMDANYAELRSAAIHMHNHIFNTMKATLSVIPSLSYTSKRIWERYERVIKQAKIERG